MAELEDQWSLRSEGSRAHALDVTATEDTDRAAGEVVVHDGRAWYEIRFIFCIFLAPSRNRALEAVAQHGIHAVMFDIDVQEHQS
jgi:hypothetical protein